MILITYGFPMRVERSSPIERAVKDLWLVFEALTRLWIYGVFLMAVLM